MNKKNKRYQIFIIASLAVLALVWGNKAMLSAATPPEPSYGTATVDGNYAEWDLTNDYFADMWRAGKAPGDHPNPVLESKLYLRYDCEENVLYALVLSVNDTNALMQAQDAFIKLGNSNKLVDGDYGDDGTAPDFQWVGVSGNYAQGFEASAPLAEGSYNNLNVHLQVDNGGSQTSAVEDRAIDLTIDCPEDEPDDPDIDIEKATNGEDADTPTGPTVDGGSTVTWTYEVKNTGNVPLMNVVVTDDNGTPGDNGDDFNPVFHGGDTNNDSKLDLDETWTYEASGTAILGQYKNWSYVVGYDDEQREVNDKDPSHYYGEERPLNPGIDIEKATNGYDADLPQDGPQLIIGSPVTWTYVVTNTGDVPLSDVNVEDDNGTNGKGDDFSPLFVGGDTNNDDKLDLDEIWTYEAFGIAEGGQYGNIAVVTGKDPKEKMVEDEDPSHYFGICVLASDIDDILSDPSKDGKTGDRAYPGAAGSDPVIAGGTEPIPPELILIGMKADFEAEFKSEPGRVCVQFINTSQNGEKFYWEFGDGTTSTEENPFHCYTNPPNKFYDVSLTIMCPYNDEIRDTKTKTRLVVVHKEAMANFTAYPIAGAPGLEVQFMNHSGGGASHFLWKYGDGTEEHMISDVRTALDPTHTYDGEGAYTVSLKVWGNGGEDSMRVEDMIYIDPDFRSLELLEAGATAPGEEWDNAIDHDVSSSNAKTTAMKDDAWAVFGFADSTATKVHKLRMMSNNAHGTVFTNHLTKEFELWTSMDGSNYDLAYQGSFSSKYGWAEFEFDPVEAKYLKLKLTSARGAGSPYAVLTEFQVFGETVQETKTEKMRTMAALGDGGNVATLPEHFGLEQNYPNPFNPETTIQFQLSDAADVTINIYNLRGELVTTLFSSRMDAGYHQVVWSGQGREGIAVGSGVYLYTLRAVNSSSETYRFTRKMTFIK
jgi:PKD repeat protein